MTEPPSQSHLDPSLQPLDPNFTTAKASRQPIHDYAEFSTVPTWRQGIDSKYKVNIKVITQLDWLILNYCGIILRFLAYTSFISFA